MPIQYSQASAYVKELRKWEWRPAMHSDTMVAPLSIEEGGRGLAGYNPTEHPYPKMLYKAHKAMGGPVCDLSNGGGYCVVHSESEEAIQRGQGYHPSQQEAIDAVHAQDLVIAKEAALINNRDKGMTAKAKIEAQAVKEQHAHHLGEIPETPIRRRRAKKAN